MHTAPVNGVPTCERICARIAPTNQSGTKIRVELKKLEGYATQLEGGGGVVPFGCGKVFVSFSFVLCHSTERTCLMSSSSCGAQVGIYNITAIKLDKVKLSQLRVTHALAAVNQARVRSVTEGHDPVMRAAAAAALVHAKDVAMAETVAAAAASVASASAAAVPAAVPVVAAPAEPLADSTPVSAAAPLLATPVVELAAAAALAAAPLVVAAPLAAPLVVAVPLAAPAATSAAAPPSAVASVVSAAALAAGHTTNRSFYTAVGTGTLLVGKREVVVSTGAAPAAAPPPSLLSQVSRIVQTQSGLLPRHPQTSTAHARAREPELAP